MLGDFNFSVPGEFALDLATADFKLEATPLSGISARWHALLSELTDLTDGSHTHYYKQSGHTNRIDRVLTSMPRSMLIQMPARAHVRGDPVSLEKSGISDHSPVQVTLLQKVPVPAEIRPIPVHVANHPGFAQLLDCYLQELDFTLVAPPTQYRLMAIAIRAVALRIRNQLSSPATPSPKHLLTLMASISRAVGFQNRRVATTLLEASPYARRWLVVEGGRVSLRAPAEFEEKFARLKQTELEHRLPKRATPGSDSARGRALEAGLRRKLSLWSRSQPKAVLSGVCDGENVITDKAGMDEALATHWRRVFRERIVDPSAAADLASEAPQLPPMDPPSRGMLRAAIRVARNAAPGADGIPPAAWRAAGQRGEDHLFDSLLWTLSGKSIGILLELLHSHLSAQEVAGRRH